MLLPKAAESWEESGSRAIACREQPRCQWYNLQAPSLQQCWHAHFHAGYIPYSNQWLPLREIKFLLQTWTKHCQLLWWRMYRYTTCTLLSWAAISSDLSRSQSTGKPAAFAGSSSVGIWRARDVHAYPRWRHSKQIRGINREGCSWHGATGKGAEQEAGAGVQRHYCSNSGTARETKPT